jgi:hypothetical protein
MKVKQRCRAQEPQYREQVTEASRCSVVIDRLEGEESHPQLRTDPTE